MTKLTRRNFIRLAGAGAATAVLAACNPNSTSPTPTASLSPTRLPQATLPPPTAVARAVFLTTQEALANIARHARATQVTVITRRLDETIKLQVLDNGRGFDMATQNQTIGHGLSNMRARAEELQGACSIESAPGKGTKIELVLPYS